ncbi:MAG: Phosphomannomutase [uncultured Sphingomonadaceae bacterium]|uniref:phosphomannomutase n=1 Tax=uncultured Sphingomonadaceae bacterium TaxID=169976 RepID=A0A6J4U0K2_9SPHN|nr:MAG: Phosphomannomutase [uncultured Sphingomonadaceae bacterium]
MNRLVAFDLDGTLAESKQAIEATMAEALATLLTVAQVAIISGGDWPQFEKQVIVRLAPRACLERLWILPTSGAKLFRFQDGRWNAVYQESFPAEEKTRILAAIDGAVRGAGFKDARTWGEQVEDRGSQLTFSALGQEAPLDAKKAWDPDFTKRKALQAALRAALPNLSVNIGGSTSIDITQKGVDKGYGLRRLAEESGLTLDAMLFVGDAIYPGGNDYPAKEAGVDTIAVRDVAETLTVIAAITARALGRAERMSPA